MYIILPDLQLDKKKIVRSKVFAFKFFRSSNIDCIGPELRLLMTGVSFLVKRRYAGSRTEELYTHSLTFRICSNTYDLFQVFF